MSLAVLLASALVSCSASPAKPRATEQTAEEMAPSVSIEREWSGRAYTAASEPGGKPDRIEAFAVRSPEALAAFVGRIPKQEISMTAPAPPSDDPLLQGLDIDFATSALLVVVRGDSMYVGPKIIAVGRAGDGLHASVAMPPLGDAAMLAAQEGVGTYHAVLVPTFAGEARFDVEDAP